MKAAYLLNKQIHVGELDDPIPGPGEVLVRTHTCGLCASDLHIKQHGQAAKVRPDMKVVFLQDWETPEERLAGTSEILRQLANLAANKKAA